MPPHTFVPTPYRSRPRRAVLKAGFERCRSAFVFGGGLVVVAVIVYIALKPAPGWIVGHPHVSAEALLRAEGDSRTALLQALGGVAVLGGLFFTARSYWSSTQAQITDRFARSVGLLGAAEPSVRIGALHALDRIARDSRRDYSTVVELLLSFVRERVGISAQMGLGEVPTIAIDVQTALSLLARRPFHDLEDRRLELLALDLSGAKLSDAQFDYANFGGANLDHAVLIRASLHRAHFGGASLSHAFLSNADLSDASLYGANLRGAMLRGADLTGARLHDADLSSACLSGVDNDRAPRDYGPTLLARANLSGAELAGADLCGVDLSEVVGLTRDQLSDADTDESTNLPADLE
jgi:hypothetical protein